MNVPDIATEFHIELHPHTSSLPPAGYFSISFTPNLDLILRGSLVFVYVCLEDILTLGSRYRSVASFLTRPLYPTERLGEEQGRFKYCNGESLP